ncbi:MAG TPA: LuxR C-terminal-related transcriptional regulator [Aggregatilineaceae bacterium]|nr:LuxR C-terminal-related transcriptional regulator [Aggregatilineaceae bacterium]
MLNALLRTKLYIPPVERDSVARPPLLQRLDEGRRRKLTLVCAPAGFGKTTLLGQWAARSGMPVAWLSLDEGDNDPGRFLVYLVYALQTIDARVGKAILGAFESQPPPPIEPLVIVLANDIAAMVQPFALVLDDYYTITAATVHGIVTFLLDHLPAPMHLIISTRADPPLPLARLRGRRHLVEIRAADLSFSEEEAGILLNNVLEMGLSEQQVALLTARTEGWITALQLAVLSLQGVEDSTRFITSLAGSHQYIADYLADEVLNQQPDDVKAFLLQTSILDRLNGPLCEAVTGQAQGQQRLERLQASDLFVTPLDDERNWYRYHRLFADLLRQRLDQACPEQVAALHRRASAWYGDHGFIAQAIDHALWAEDFSQAGRLIEQYSSALLADRTTLLNWLDRLPEPVMRASPPLCIAHAAVLAAAGHLERAEHRLDAAAAILEAEPPGPSDDTRDDLGQVAALRAFIAHFRGDVPGTIRFSRQALDNLRVDNLAWRSGIAMDLGDAYLLAGDVPAAGQAYRESMAAAQSSKNVSLILTAGMKLAENRRTLGHLARARELCEEGLRLADESGFAQTALASGFFMVLAHLACEWNDLDRALSDASQAVDLSAQGSLIVLQALSLIALLRVRIARQDFAEADTLIQRLDGLLRSSELPAWIASRVAAGKVRLWLAERQTAADCQKSSSMFLEWRIASGSQNSGLVPVDEQLALARLVLETDSRNPTPLDDALHLLNRVGTAAESAGMVGTLIEALVLTALVHQGRQESASAIDTLGQALALAAPEGYIRVFVDEGPPLARLLYQALERGLYPDYVGRLLAAFPSVDTARSVPQRARDVALIEPLSARELEVLRLIADGLSNQEIAQRLFLSLRTVKYHSGNIYGKLGVKNRTQALRKARELGLLSGSAD